MCAGALVVIVVMLLWLFADGDCGVLVFPESQAVKHVVTMIRVISRRNTRENREHLFISVIFLSVCRIFEDIISLPNDGVN